jgi:hypothetical protein
MLRLSVLIAPVNVLCWAPAAPTLARPAPVPTLTRPRAPRVLALSQPPPPPPPPQQQQQQQQQQSRLPWLLDPNTKGGILVLSAVLIGAPFIAYNFMLDALGWDVVKAGNVILVCYVGLGTAAWTSSYVYRVANKDMTYAKQLKDYENAVIAKRFDELSQDEVGALMTEIYPAQSEPAAPPEDAPPEDAPVQ